jgi:hypothetical protein
MSGDLLAPETDELSHVEDCYTVSFITPCSRSFSCSFRYGGLVFVDIGCVVNVAPADLSLQPPDALHHVLSTSADRIFLS